jgi:hypothetical protein
MLKNPGLSAIGVLSFILSLLAFYLNRFQPEPNFSLSIFLVFLGLAA